LEKKVSTACTSHVAFDRLLGLSLTLEPATYQMLIAGS
jgi:hypothetical protein